MGTYPFLAELCELEGSEVAIRRHVCPSENAFFLIQCCWAQHFHGGAMRRHVVDNLEVPEGWNLRLFLTSFGGIAVDSVKPKW